jgi:hypothetical protein
MIMFISNRIRCPPDNNLARNEETDLHICNSILRQMIVCIIN